MWLLVVCWSVAVVQANERVETGFLNRTYVQGNLSMPYVVYVPRDYTPSKQYPVILFLHGAGERGNDGLRQTQVGIGTAIRTYPERFPCLVVMPQCPADRWWRGEELEAAYQCLQQTMREFSCDPKRVYLTGLSMGGFGSWELLAKYPDTFAAAIPICGRGNPADAEKLKNIPLWVFHGEADTLVPPTFSREMVEALRKAGATQVKYTELPGIGHNSWDPAYSSAEVIRWLLEQKKP
ncbi:MAG: alpha/beta hydrolase-fold protein [Armatimonadetes bacterium]|nr:alpha/beta hydrolase-fold protein [Armatimonadota bacterium]